MPSPYFLYLLNTMVSETLHVSSSHSEHARGVASIEKQTRAQANRPACWNRVRLRRLIMGWSQSKLGNVLGVSSQQVRKYEKGTDRIAASRLQNVAEILEAPVAFFFEGLQRFKDIDNCSEFLPASEGLDLVKAFMRIGEPRIQAPPHRSNRANREFSGGGR